MSQNLDQAAREYATKALTEFIGLATTDRSRIPDAGTVLATSFADGARWAFAEAARIAEAGWVADFDQYAASHSQFTAQRIAGRIRAAAGEKREGTT